MKWKHFFRRKNSCSFAKDRIKLLLVSDRTNCSPDIVDKMKRDIVHVMSKYVEVDMESVEVQIAQSQKAGEDSVPTLFANVPIRNIKHYNHRMI